MSFPFPLFEEKNDMLLSLGAFSHEFLITPVGCASTQAWTDVSSSSDLKYLAPPGQGAVYCVEGERK